MIAMEAVREIMRLKGVRPTALCDILNIKSNVLSERFKQKNVSVSKLNEMLNPMGYRVVVIPNDVTIPDSGFDVE